MRRIKLLKHVPERRSQSINSLLFFFPWGEMYNAKVKKVWGKCKCTLKTNINTHPPTFSSPLCKSEIAYRTG